MDVKLMKAHCPIAKKYFVFKIEGGKATDFMPIDKTRYDALSTTDVVSETARNLQMNKYDRNRLIAKSPNIQINIRNCTDPRRYYFHCAYCNNLVVEGLGKDINDCSISVTSPRYDDIGKVVGSMKLRFHQYKGSYQDDIIFINCGTDDEIDPHKIKHFVENGGILYVSDLAVTVIEDAFPDMFPEVEYDTDEMTVTADVMDQEIRAIIGPSIEIYFDLGSWARIVRTTGKVILSTRDVVPGVVTPIMVMKTYGKGTIFYTSFHNHAVANQQELTLLKLLICKQLGVKTGKKVNDISKLLGLNFGV